MVFEQAYGVRKYADEPGLDGKPSPAEPMTLDTIFDMASLTKCLATATAVMQLVEQGKIDVDAPVVKYLPEFAYNGKENVTVRELLTHYSGLPPDVDLKDAWGLAAPDKAEGMRRAMNAKLKSAPGTTSSTPTSTTSPSAPSSKRSSGRSDLDVYAATAHLCPAADDADTLFMPSGQALRHAAEKIGRARYGHNPPQRSSLRGSFRTML